MLRRQRQRIEGEKDREQEIVKPYEVRLSIGFIFWSAVSTITFCIAVGHQCRTLLFHNENKAFRLENSSKRDNSGMPQPVLPRSKKPPQTTFTQKQYNTGASVSSSDSILARRATAVESQDMWIEYDVAPDGTVSMGAEADGVDKDGEDDEDELYQPAGQHLMVDIEHVNGAFLNSETRLAKAMMDLVQLSGLTMLSYHCHTLQPMGVSCVGVLLESHVSFHTWPIPGVITLDLFTCGDEPLLPLLPVIEKLFALPASDGNQNEPPHMLWSHKKRGFRADRDDANPEDIDIEQWMLGWREMEMKTEVASVTTEYQTIEIYDMINPRFRSLESYRKSMSAEVSYEAANPELFRPDRAIYLDGVMQSRSYGEAAYHEALVHPAMFTHAKPRRVAIIGGGEGATLREVLKHNTVEEVTMIEIDEEMVNVSRAYLPEWSDCSDLVGSADSCFDDPRVEVLYIDAVAWFLDRFSDEEKVYDGDKYDVIFMDALDPSSRVGFSDVLYGNAGLVQALKTASRDDAIFVSQTGVADTIMDPPRSTSKASQLDQFVKNLAAEGFEFVREYTESHGGYMDVWSFLVAFEDNAVKDLWYSNEAQIDLRIQYRLMETRSGKHPLRYFDGATMIGYQYQSRINQEVFCRGMPIPSVCERGQGFDPERENAPITSFEVKPSSFGKTGRGVFFKEAFPKGTYIAIEAGVHNVLVMPDSYWLIYRMMKADNVSIWKVFDDYLYGYGFSSDRIGATSVTIDVSILFLTNHGCNNTNLIGSRFSISEATADPETPEIEENLVEEDTVYNPFVDRNSLNFMNADDFTLEDVAAGTELLENYLDHVSAENWKHAVLDYRAQCLERESSAFSSYEQES